MDNKMNPSLHRALEEMYSAAEAEQAAQEWIDTYGMPDSIEAVAGLIRTKEAAGRARGIEEERKRCEGIAKP